MLEKRILITGSTGFLGRALTNELDRHRHPNSKIYTLSRLKSSDEALKKIQEIRPTQVYHLAGLSRVSSEIGFSDYFAANTIQFQHVLDALVKNLSPVKVLLTSSVHLYGNQGAVTEESNVHPQSSYAYSKYLAEEALKAFCRKSEDFFGVSVRLSSCIGPGQAEGFVTVDLAKKIKGATQTKKNSIEASSLDSFRQFMDVEDAARAFYLLMEHPQDTSFDVVNLVGHERISVSQLLDQFIRFSDQPLQIKNSEKQKNSFSGVEVLPGKFKTLFPDFSFQPLESTLKKIWEKA